MTRPPPPVREPRTTARVLMVRPASFGANPETAATNAFQRGAPGSAAELLARARAEFDALAAALRSHGVEVLVLADTPEPPKPDAVFPNNWVSFHADGRVVLYPMLVPSRQAEVRAGLLAELGLPGARTLVDLRAGARGEALEGTGSLVLDRAERVAYACRSPRTSLRLLGRFCEALGYEACAFDARDARGTAIYHTNVMMAVGEGFAILCADSIPDAGERETVRARLRAGGHALVEITLAQLDEFAGNALALRSRAGAPLLVLSERARRALDPTQRAALERHATLVSADLTTIETCGGGSARCMIAEIF